MKDIPENIPKWILKALHIAREVKRHLTVERQLSSVNNQHLKGV
jgi:hypothetical protein